MPGCRQYDICNSTLLVLPNVVPSFPITACGLVSRSMLVRSEDVGNDVYADMTTATEGPTFR